MLAHVPFVLVHGTKYSGAIVPGEKKNTGATIRDLVGEKKKHGVKLVL